jgi:probable DNA metabolism protein
MITAQFEPTLLSWRDEARRLLARNISPDQIQWSQSDGTLSLFGNQSDQKSAEDRQPFSVSREFLTLAQEVSCARDDSRWSLLYRILYRLKNEDKHLLQITVDPDIYRALELQKSIRKGLHKMHAFVRFKKSDLDDQEVYLAWHCPEHLILEMAAPFFVRRFGDRPWSILTPDLSAHWTGHELKFTAGIPQNQFLLKDDFENLWKTYYSSIFNPARLKLKAMKTEMPTKYWKSLPEVEIVQQMIREAPARIEKMARNQNQNAVVPPAENLKELHQAALKCTACPLYERAENLVFGEGPESAEIMIVGEQPGDFEDQRAKPFVGPAGEILNKCLSHLQLLREELYLTNAVKHFKWKPSETPQGKIRLHQKPSGSEMHACRPWLQAEIQKVKPKVIVILGATAATSLLGRLPKISQERGKLIFDSAFAEALILSWHPAAILRSSTPEEAKQRTEELTQDLQKALEYCKRLKKTPPTDSANGVPREIQTLR